MSSYELSSVIIASIALIISFVSLYFSFYKLHKQRPKIEIEVSKLHLIPRMAKTKEPVENLLLSLRIINRSTADIGISCVNLLIGNATYQGYKFVSSVTSNKIIRDLFLVGSQSITEWIEFNSLRNIENNPIFIEVVTTQKTFKFNITKDFLSYTSQNNHENY